MIKNMKISTKLYVLVALTSFVILAIGLYGLNNLDTVNNSLESVYKDRVIPLKQLKIISDMYSNQVVDATHKMRDHSIDFKEGKKEIKKAKELITKNWGIYLASGIDSEEKKVADQIQELMKNSEETMVQLESVVEKEDTEALSAFVVKDMYPLVDPIIVKINELMDVQLLVADREFNKGDKVYADSRIHCYILIFLGVFISLFISILIVRSIHKAIKNASGVVAKLSEGDLTVDIDSTSKDELGMLLEDLKKMIHKFKSVISYVSAASVNIVAASQELSSSSQQMSEGATEQAAATEEVSSSMEEMVANVQHNTENAQQTEKISVKAAGDAMEGSIAVNQAGVSMKSIANKITIISDIARQTNILALNAAVEAARAGEQGRGFAVVAAEVRKLAEKSQLAAVEINELSQSSVAIAEKSAKILEQMVPSIQHTSKLVGEISASSMEQNLGAGQINNALQQLNQVTQQNATTSEEMAASAEELSSQADQLNEIISFFKFEEGKYKSAEAQKKHSASGKNGLTKYDRNHGNVKSKEASTNGTGVHLNMDGLDSEYEKF